MPKLSTAVQNAISDAVTPSLTYCSLYTGTIPSTGNTSPTGTLLVSWTGSLAWGASSSGTAAITGAPVTSDTAVATGTAGYARLWDGTSTAIYCTVGTSGADLNLSSLSITSGGTVNITSGSITAPST